MATLNYSVSGTKAPSEIKIRFVNGRAIDITTGTSLYVDPNYWDPKSKKVRNVAHMSDRAIINAKLTELRNFVLSKYNIDFMNGEIINRIWLQKTVTKYFNRPSDDVKKAPELYKVYVSDFGDWWLIERAPKHKVRANKYMDEQSVAHYSSFLRLFKIYQGKEKIRFSEVDNILLDKFSEFLTSKLYSKNTTKRHLNRFKFFCARAEEEGITINQSYKKRVFVAEPEVKYKEPYFNEDEIDIIYRHDFSKSTELDNARDNLIIGLWTGLRVSDFLTKLNIDNFDGDFIEIQTEKTDTWVSIPVHWMIREILQKRNGKLPGKISDQKFNLLIKVICKKLNFDQKMLGGVSKFVDPLSREKRKVVGIYAKYELVTSHICRRSFATNIYGKIPNSALMAIGGWTTEAIMLDYIKKTKR